MSFLRFAALLAAIANALAGAAYSQTTVEVGSNGTVAALAFHDVASRSTSSAGSPALTRIHEGTTVQFFWRGSNHNIVPYDATTRNSGVTVPVSYTAITASSTWSSSERSSSYRCTIHPVMTGRISAFEVARSLRVTGPASAVAGTPFSITVTAIGQNGTTDALYRGTIQFSSSDSNASVPANYSLVDADNGSRPFSGLVLRTPAAATTITVSDPANGLTGQATLRVDDPSRPRAPGNLRVQP